MTEIAASDFRHPRRYVRLDTILRLRWLAVLGQLVAIFIVVQGLEFDVEVVPCVTIVGLSALLNLVLQIAFNPMQRLEPVYAAALLALNIVELAGLLFFTGGLQNPFSFLFLAPVLISATALPVRLTIALGVLAVACASVLVFFHLPLPWDSDEPLVLPPIYLFGVWLSIVVAIGVTSLYAFQVTEEARKLSDALAATELVLTREQHLTQLDGLAAAAAHELGTPLSTIFLISRELEQGLQDDSPLAGDIKTLREQAQRCRDILAKITQLSATGAPFDRMPLSTLIEEIVAPHRDFGVAIKVRIAVAGVSEPVGTRNPAILYGVGNILENAVDFARTTVEVNAWWNSETVEIVISDDGPGFAPDIIKRIGEPYLSRRKQRGRRPKRPPRPRPRGVHRPHAAGAHRRQGLLHQPDLSGSWRRGPDRLAAPPLRGRRNISRTSSLVGPQAAAGWRRSTLCGLGSAACATPYVGRSETRDTRTVNAIAELTGHADRSLLIVEDDKPFLERLSRAMETRGFTVTSCDSVSRWSGADRQGRAGLRGGRFAARRRQRPRRGVGAEAQAPGRARHRADRLRQHRHRRDRGEDGRGGLSLEARRRRRRRRGTCSPAAPRNPSRRNNPMSADRVRWEHIQRIYEMCNRNVSETARRLNMHRRTLQRILAKRAPR